MDNHHILLDGTCQTQLLQTIQLNKLQMLQNTKCSFHLPATHISIIT